MAKRYSKYFVCFMLSMLLCTNCYSLALAADPLNKYKAAFILSFVKYIQNSSGNSSICIAGDQGLSDILKNKSNVRSIDLTSENPTNCALVFISKNSKADISTILKAISNKQIITVSDTGNFVNNGGLIEVYEDGGRLKFALNIKKATALKFKVNSKLVEIADKTQ